MMKTRIALSVLLLWGYAAFAGAESKTLVSEYTYVASDLDSKISCQAIAKEQLKRELLEQIGTYVESKTVVKDHQLEKDDIRTLAAGVVQLTVLDEKWDGRVYWIKAEMKADPDEVLASINKLKNDEQLALELEEARREAAQAMEQVALLKDQLAKSGADPQMQDQYNDAIGKLAASDYFETGSALTVAGNYEGAAFAYDNAIRLQPRYAKAYINRSVVSVQLGRYAQAAQDLQTAASLNPSRETAYYNRVGQQKTTREAQAPTKLPEKAPAIPAGTHDPLQRLLDAKVEKTKEANEKAAPSVKAPVREDPARGQKAAQPRQAPRQEIQSPRKQLPEEGRKKKTQRSQGGKPAGENARDGHRKQ